MPSPDQGFLGCYAGDEHLWQRQWQSGTGMGMEAEVGAGNTHRATTMAPSHDGGGGGDEGVRSVQVRVALLLSREQYAAQDNIQHDFDALYSNGGVCVTPLFSLYAHRGAARPLDPSGAGAGWGGVDTSRFGDSMGHSSLAVSGAQTRRTGANDTLQDVAVCHGDWVCLPAAVPTITSPLGSGDGESAVAHWLVGETVHYLDAHMPTPPPLPSLSHGGGQGSDGGGVVPPAHAFMPGVYPVLSVSDGPYSVVGPALLLTGEIETHLAHVADRGVKAGNASAQMEVFLAALLAACPADMAVAVVPMYTIPASQVPLTILLYNLSFSSQL